MTEQPSVASNSSLTATEYAISHNVGGSVDVITSMPITKQLLTNLLQSNSMARPGKRLGNGSFVIGGDMNTTPYALSALLIKCRRENEGIAETTIFAPMWARHGDVCITAGLNASELQTRATNHDPQHVPYGIAWSAPDGSATAQLAPSLPAGSAAVAESATEQPSHAAPPLEATVPQVTQSSSTPVEPPPSQVTPKPTQPLPEVPQAVTAAASLSATEQPVPLPPGLSAPPQQPLSQAPPQQPPSQDQHDESGAVASAATEHSQELTHNQEQDQHDESHSQELTPNQEMIKSIVSQFLGGVTFDSTEAEDLIRRCLQEEESLPLDMQERLEEAFSPIFFNYPNGLQDRTMWTPRDPGQYIHTWYSLAEWRTAVATEHERHESLLSKSQVEQIFDMYMKQMDWKPSQMGRKYTYYKSCTEVNLRNTAGSTFVAKAIWAIGMPTLPSFATERRAEPLSDTDLQRVPAAAVNVLNWLDLLATALCVHRATPEYAEAVRKSGVAHAQSGLTETELQAKKERRAAKLDLRTAEALAKKWNARQITCQTATSWELELLHAFWDGSLQKRLAELGAPNPCRRSPYASIVSVTTAREHGTGK